jgi:hypothetical protein
MPFAVGSNLDLPFLPRPVPANAFDSRRVIRPWSYIHEVLRGIGEAKIIPTIVAAAKIAMVNVGRWPFPGHIKPSEAVGSIKPIINLDDPIMSKTFGI